MKMKKKEEVVSLSKHNELARDYDEMKEKCDALVKNGTEMGEKIVSLKKEIASLKGQNTRLKRDVEHYKQLNKEGDELNEQRIAEINDLKDKLKEAERCVRGKDRVIDGLNDQTLGLRETILTQETLIKDLRGDLKAYEANTDWFNALPWWRKPFAKM